MEYEEFRRSVLYSVANILAKHRGSIARIKSRDIAKIMGIKVTPVKAYTIFVILSNFKDVTDIRGRKWVLNEIYSKKVTGVKIAEYVRVDL